MFPADLCHEEWMKTVKPQAMPAASFSFLYFKQKALAAIFPQVLFYTNRKGESFDSPSWFAFYAFSFL